MNKKESLLIAFCLLFTALITVATSKTSDVGNPTTTMTAFGAASNCSNATYTHQQIVVSSAGTISEPPGADFRFFGLPTPTLVIAADNSVSGPVAGFTRVCTYSEDHSNGFMHVYSCYENSFPVCQVSFTPL